MTTAFSPRSLAEAVGRLAEDPDLRPVAGCTDLMVCEPEDRADLPGVLDLTRIPELRGVRERNGGLEIGAATSFRAIGDDPLVRERCPALARAARVVGGWQIQNRATIGGNIANASPAGDSLPALLALDASVLAVGPDGERTIPYGEFHIGYRKTALARGEIIARVLLPAPPEGSIQTFHKVGTRAAQAISKVVVAAIGRVKSGEIDGLRIAAGSVAPVPMRLTGVEYRLTGLPASSETADLAADLAASSVDPIDDVRSTAAYRRWALGRVVRRIVLDLAAAS